MLPSWREISIERIEPGVLLKRRGARGHKGFEAAPAFAVAASAVRESPGTTAQEFQFQLRNAGIVDTIMRTELLQSICNSSRDAAQAAAQS